MLEHAWHEEQQRRHQFWADADEGVKAEFILGEVGYHSPIYGRRWIASTQITRRLLPYVYDRKLGMVGCETVMIRLTRNDYEPDICFWPNERAAALGQKQSAFPAPDFIIEILSDSTRTRDYGIKKLITPGMAFGNTGLSTPKTKRSSSICWMVPITSWPGNSRMAC